MSWTKQELLIEPPTHLGWVASHAAVPFADVEVEGDRWIYFTTRDQHGRSHIARASLEARGSSLSASVEPEPVLAPGRLGTFDDSGVMTSSLVRHGGRQFLYYQGWSLGTTVPFYVFAGCAVSDDGGRSFTRTSEAPVLGRSALDPVLVMSPWVSVESGRWRMWYGSAKGWSEPGEGQHYYVNIKHATSEDGIDWGPGRDPVVDLVGGNEYAVGRPCVVRGRNRYSMWYSHRGDSYRIGYAESDDGLGWVRKDDAPEAGIEPSEAGWDSEMVEYGTVFDVDGTRFMLYNGNGFGESGTGYAVWEGGG